MGGHWKVSSVSSRPSCSSQLSKKKKTTSAIIVFLVQLLCFNCFSLPSGQCSKLLVELKSKLNSVKDETLLTMANGMSDVYANYNILLP